MRFERSVGRVDAVEISWIGVRPVEWALHDAFSHLPFCVVAILFEVGVGRSGWLTGLAASDWYSGLAPRPEDLATGEEPSGRWSMPSGAGEAGVAALLSSSHVPDAQWWAGIAVTPETGAAQRPAVLGLVSALRQRRSTAGDPLPVVVTLEGPSLDDEPFVSQLLERGAFVIRAGRDVGGDHLHHFPLRAFAADPRLVCIDLFDTLSLWRPGRPATLHLLPLNFEKAVQAMEDIPVPPVGAQAVDVRFHFRPDWADVQLEENCELADYCASRFVRDDGHYQYTNDRRLDGVSGSVDLLIID